MAPKELEQTLRALLGEPMADAELRGRLESLAAREMSFAGFTWLFGPELYRRNRVLFRPLVLSHFSGFMRLPKWKTERIRWKGSKAQILEAWLGEADRADDDELFRRLYEWRLSETFDWRKRDARSQQILRDLGVRFRAASTAAQRQVVLRKFDLWFTFTEDEACRLYALDPRVAGPFILRRLPGNWLGDNKRALWSRLLALADARQDEDFRWRLYRRQVPLTDWTRACLDLCGSVRDGAELCRELERRHPEGWAINLADGFRQVVERRGRDAFPYLARHLNQVRRSWLGGGGLGRMVRLAQDRGWWDWWAALIRTCCSSRDFNQTVQGLVEERGVAEAQVVERLLALAGASREWNWPGLGLATVHQLEEAVALALYERFPELVRGPYRVHLQPSIWGQRYTRLLDHFMRVADDDLIDHLASRIVTRCGRWGNAARLLEDAERLADYYGALRADEAVFSRRAARVLSGVPSFSIWSYAQLVRENRLARLLFERSASAYLADPASLADLVEGAEIHVMALAYRALGLNEDRARAQAEQHLPLLLGTLLRPMQRGTRALALGALANAATTLESARMILERARDAMTLPDARYPKDALVGLMARLLHRWPELRSAAEQPLVYQRTQP